MGLPNTLRACAIAGTLVFASVAGVSAQSFQINGRVKVEGGSLDDTRMVVFKNGEKQRTVNNGLGKFSLDLELNATYILSFEKAGFVTKTLSFDTHAPAEAAANGFTPFTFAVSIFKQYDDVNTVVFNQPVGMIRYSSEADDFDYDTDYTKSIQSALEKAMEEVAQKQEEEKGKDAEEARKRAEEDKARAKAEADKAKADAETARAKAQAEKEAAEAARKEQELKQAEAKKAELAAKKAEEQRLAEERKKPKEAPAPKPAPEPKKKVPPPEPPPPVAKVRERKAPPPPPPVRQATANGLRTTPHEGAEGRRNDAVHEVVEASPVERARPNEGAESKPDVAQQAPVIERHEELIVEPNKVITRIQLDDGHEKREYSKVVHKYGSVFYFKDGQSCSKLTYEHEALAETR